MTLFSFIVFPIVGNTHASTEGVLLKYYHFKTLAFHEKKISNYRYLKEIVILPEGKFNELEALHMMNRIGQIDSNILKRLVATHVQVKLITGKITNEPSISYLKGTSPRGYSASDPTWDDVPGVGGTKLVLARIGYSEKGMGHGSINLELHETAHSIDRYAFHLIRDNQDFLTIWERESSRLFPNQPYFINYPEEYFAETFAMFYVNENERNELNAKAPLTYRYIENLSKYHPIPNQSSIVRES